MQRVPAGIKLFAGESAIKWKGKAQVEGEATSPLTVRGLARELKFSLEDLQCGSGLWRSREARQNGRRPFFRDYALLGDDILIADAKVAQHYMGLVSRLGFTDERVPVAKRYSRSRRYCPKGDRTVAKPPTRAASICGAKALALFLPLVIYLALSLRDLCTEEGIGDLRSDMICRVIPRNRAGKALFLLSFSGRKALGEEPAFSSSSIYFESGNYPKNKKKSWRINPLDLGLNSSVKRTRKEERPEEAERNTLTLEEEGRALNIFGLAQSSEKLSYRDTPRGSSTPFPPKVWNGRSGNSLALVLFVQRNSRPQTSRKAALLKILLFRVPVMRIPNGLEESRSLKVKMRVRAAKQLEDPRLLKDLQRVSLSRYMWGKAKTLALRSKKARVSVVLLAHISRNPAGFFLSPIDWRRGRNTDSVTVRNGSYASGLTIWLLFPNAFLVRGMDSSPYLHAGDILKQGVVASLPSSDHFGIDSEKTPHWPVATVRKENYMRFAEGERRQITEISVVRDETKSSSDDA
ncbi:hypothetical protein SASPL_155511 (mitochondrion) [Salvia splendens]|uniref:Uncharacterized protein n=1 Tax=Salvia splendens TaxID=180675 RepID=A0A8X8YY76_SALSN|nr:hypothetical protein SASPL_156318 [Salvia splendens]KAG6384659.1 hypothetical protein SASPL_155511 [Salvia splendens]